jgi:hypothetical protein
MARLTDGLLVALLLTGCGGGSESRADAQAGDGGGQGEDVDACALLTAEEIQAAAGWAPDTTDGRTYGTTNTCNYMGQDVSKQSVVLVVARPAPKVSSSAELAAQRTEAAKREPDIKMTFTPIEDLGVPAVRSDVEGSPDATVEAVVGRRLLGVTTSDFEVAKTLAGKAVPRLR